MLQTIKKILSSKKAKQYADSRNIGLYIFAIVVLAISWSTVRAVQSNYQLQKEISVLEQENKLLRISNDTVGLKNRFLETDQFLELSARQNLGLAAPGETVLVVPKNVADKYIDKSLLPATNDRLSLSNNQQSKYIQNLENWRDFLLGRTMFEN